MIKVIVMLLVLIHFIGYILSLQFCYSKNLITPSMSLAPRIVSFLTLMLWPVFIFVGAIKGLYLGITRKL